MNKPPYSTCGECQRWRKATHCVVPEIVEFSKEEGPVYVVVGQDPGAEEDRVGRPWIGRSGAFVRRLVERLRLLGAKEAILTNSLRCLPETARTPTKEETLACLPNLENDLRLASQRGSEVVVIACGRAAEAALRLLNREACYVPHPASYVRTGQPPARWLSVALLAIKTFKRGFDAEVVVLDHTHVEELSSAEELAVDAEFLDIEHPYLISVSDGQKSVYFTPEDFHELSFLSGKTLISHNAVVEGTILGSMGISAKEWVDTLSWVRAFDDRLKADLRTVSAYMFDAPYTRPKELRKGILTADVVRYNCMDSSASYKTYMRLKPFMKDSLLQKRLLSRLVPFLLDVGRRGIRVDQSRAKVLKEKYQEELEEVKEELKKYSDINWNSVPKALDYFRRKGLDVKSLDKAVLSTVGMPEAELLLRYRKKQKILSTYLNRLDGVDRVTFMLSPSGTETGRLSFLGGIVNIHTIPEEIREVFVPDPGYCWVKADYKTHEVVVLAWLAESPVVRRDVVDWSREPKPITELLAGGDPYDQLAYVYEGLVGKEKVRDLTKMTFLALMYGAGASRIYQQALRMGVQSSREEISRVVKELRARLSSIDALREYYGRERSPLKGGGFLSTFSWPPLWRRRLFEVRTQDDWEEWRKALVNSPTQGAAADICTLAAITLHEKGYCVLNVVHDEIDLQIPEDSLEEALKEIREVMLEGWAGELGLPCLPALRVDFSIREHW